MKEQAVEVRWTVTNSELEALNLEWTWIKEFSPRFNVAFNEDDKSYLFLSVSVQDQIPRVFFTRQKHAKNLKNFGPFPKGWAIKQSLDQLLHVFPVRTCTIGVFRQAIRLNRPCLLYDIGKCSAPCVGKISIEDHRGLLKQLMRFYSGANLELIKDLKAQMLKLSKAERFEQASKIRDQIQTLEIVIDKNAVVLDESFNADVIGIYRSDIEAGAQIFLVREGRIRGENSFVVDINSDLVGPELVQQVLLQFYENYPDLIPARRIYLSEAIAEPQAVLELLEGELKIRPKFEYPQRGLKKEIVQRAISNAQMILRTHQMKRATNLEARTRALQELQEVLNLPTAPLRIEGYDISTTLQTNQVGSMVVFEDGVPKKKFYRKFNVDTSDDTSAIHEVISRRFNTPPERSTKFAYDTNMILIDGGLPQVNAAAAALAETNHLEVTVIGLAKKLEEVWLPHAEYPIILARGSAALYLLQQIRDESHRFAITGHRKRRAQHFTKSALDAIPGIGPKTRRKLLSKYHSLARIQQTPVSELAKISGISAALAQKILDYLARLPKSEKQRADN
jgi:excinuclease ABC subunit C